MSTCVRCSGSVYIVQRRTFVRQDSQYIIRSLGDPQLHSSSQSALGLEGALWVEEAAG